MASTIKDVAKMAEVSISTVSRVINDSKPVSPEARRRVLQAIKVLDYTPNEVARSLVKRKSHLIGVIVDDIGTSYVSKILRGVEEIGRMYNYDILLTCSYGDPEVEIDLVKLLEQKQVGGILVIASNVNEKLLEKLEESKLPYLEINRFHDNEEKLTVRIEYEEISYEMVNYIISKGHKKIAAVLKAHDVEKSQERYKLKGYERAITDAGLEEYIISTKGITEKAIAEVSDQIDKAIKSGVTAFFCTLDEIAIHIINQLRDKGIKVPDDISITGFGGTDLTEIYRPLLTTVKISYYDIGAVAIRRILKMINKENTDEDEKSILPLGITKRDTVKDLNQK
ncbi:LacI family DNA-binding transcriptional regulator [Peptoniphilus obesi]|uniref:LacI family DNA-binding transcriptional regulator n=1 Tax=Peptoniphilus obesi TaxID=1472765 RepID=UPI0004B92DAC|nr:LacI family DNA-binding transcriptional regulator [Peptoniphilus obesi]